MNAKTKFAKFLVVAVCLALAMFMTIEVAHTHAAGPEDASHCQLCASAHVAVDTQPLWVTTYVVRLLGPVISAEPTPPLAPVVFTASIRPPPVAL